MTTLIAIFLLALFWALIITPAVARLGIRFGIVDQPGDRRVHDRPVPRIGGLAIYLAFFGAFLPLFFPWVVSQTRVLGYLAAEPRLIPIAVGSMVAFGLGLYDDNRGLGPGVKFGVQALAALIAYFGGVQISALSVPGMGTVHLGLFGLPATVFWILLVINAINLIDGLDGLAAGVSFFVCMVLVILSVISGRFMVAGVLAALAGAILGFLRYNFNPAVVFMGDGGSYFLGYMLATTSILGAIKGQAAVTILIPIVALGVPLMDTIWATVRRFAVGKALFQPDREHFHHRLLKLGFSHRSAVLVIYGTTVVLGLAALALVNLQNELAGLILAVIAAVVVIGIRRLGYMDYLKRDRIMDWLRELGDDSGLSHERRSFLLTQIRISEAQSLEALWHSVIGALEILEFDLAALYLNRSLFPGVRSADDQPGRRNGPGAGGAVREAQCRDCPGTAAGAPESGLLAGERRGTPALQASVCQRRHPPEFNWSRVAPEDMFKRCPLRIELAIGGDGNNNLGTLVLLKDIDRNGMAHYTLKRVEHLRRNVGATLAKILGVTR